MSVKWNIIAPVKKPADLEGVAPGKLPEKLLKPVKGGALGVWVWVHIFPYLEPDKSKARTCNIFTCLFLSLYTLRIYSYCSWKANDSS